MVEYITTYECPYCNSEFNCYAEAEDCAEECHLLTVNDPNTLNGFVCEFCKKSFNSERKAIKCEEYHIETKDKFFYEFETVRSRKILEEASKHPSQMKLTNT